MTKDQVPMTNGFISNAVLIGRHWSFLLVWSLGLGSWSFAAGAEPPPAVLEAQQQRVETIQRATKTAVCIFAKEGTGGGSGVVVSADGYALTNFHVVQPAGSYMKCSMADGKLYDAVVVGIDPVGDVGLIKLLGREDFPVAPLADSDRVQPGDWCFAVGNPFLLATDFQPTVTLGIVSGVHRYQYPSGTLIEYADCIQTDASINPGNSGGPLFNDKGEVIGINGRISFEKRVRVNVGVGWAISINQIKHFLGCLKSGRIVDHATLGATVAAAEDGSVLVDNILETSDAWRRGLRYDDEIVSFGGRSIGSQNDFKNALGIFPKGWRVPLVYRRDGKETEILVRLAGVHGEEELINKVQRPPRPQQPKEGPDGQKGRPRDGQPGPLPLPRLPIPVPQPKPQIPAEAAKLIQSKPGYANYYFNELNRDRVWSAFAAKGDFAKVAGIWTLEGDLADGGKISVTLGDDESSGSFPTGAVTVDANKDLTDQLGPPGSGGLLAALHLWRRLLVMGPQKYGQLHYYGTAPCPGIEGLADTLVGVNNVVETSFVFDPASGQLALLEMFGDAEQDPCEVRFLDYQPQEGRQFPTRIVVQFGDKQILDVRWTKIDLQPGTGGAP
ncbi:MAG TPA: trypsin-like peptidase domain-containing protein [Pirellulaceae bacterium]|nr:trypsin-like peptidase domain-containing protein [Pirellulaceae bacterium]